MARPPTPIQRRYRGRLRRAMQSSLRHVTILSDWDTKYVAGPVTNYPNQLANLTEVQLIRQCAVQLQAWLAAVGPIPSRVP